MTEADMIARAKQYMEALAEGFNPLTGTPLVPGECASEERMRRCFAYTAQVLERALEAEARRERKAFQKKASDFSLTADQLADFEYSEKPISASEFRRRINQLIDETATKALKLSSITGFLLGAGLLQLVGGEKLPTDAGDSLGITVEERTSVNGRPYRVVLYSRAAQQFLVDNIDALCTLNADKQVRVSLNNGAAEDEA